MIYLDNNATTALLPIVNSQMHQFLDQNQPYNASAIHSLGRKAKSILEDARSQIINKIAKGYKLIFTSNATIANNMIVNSFENVYASSVEHSSILKLSHNIISVDCNGLLDLYDLKAKIKNVKKPFLVSVIHAHNETGVVNNIAEIASIVHENGGFLHSDAVQSLGKITSDLSSFGADFYTISAHKIGGPLGIAALLYKQNVFKPFVIGGGQELGYISGTENLLGIVGFAAAVNAIDVENYVSFNKVFTNKIETKIEQNNGIIVGKGVNRIPNTNLIIHPKKSSKSQIITFDMANIAVSIGSACSSGTVKKSATLTAIGLPEDQADRVLRISTGLCNTLQEIDKFIEIWCKM